MDKREQQVKNFRACRKVCTQRHDKRLKRKCGERWEDEVTGVRCERRGKQLRQNSCVCSKSKVKSGQVKCCCAQFLPSIRWGQERSLYVLKETAGQWRYEVGGVRGRYT